MFDVPCDWAVLDTVSIYGTEQNVSQNVMKWRVDAEGMRRRFGGRNKAQRDIVRHDPDVADAIEDLHEDGEDAVSLDAELFEIALLENRYLFVDFYAGWCSHCRDLMPTWEVLGELMTQLAETSVEGHLDELKQEGDHIPLQELDLAKKVNVPVLIAKVDCEQHPDFCLDHDIWAYPTLRLFVNGQRYGADYGGDRTLQSLTNYLATVEHQSDNGEGVLAQAERLASTRLGKPTLHTWRNTRDHPPQWKEQDHVGCQLSGFLLLDHVPGNFQIMARSNAHDFDPRWTNASHQIHSLSFGDTSTFSHNNYVPPNLFSKLSPLNGNVYITTNLHQAYHHHFKIVSHSFPYTLTGTTRTVKLYQPLSQSQLSQYRYEDVPEAKFIYDLSPITIRYRRSNARKWYDYLTSLMAIVGGTFTVVGMVDSSIQRISSKKHL